MTQPLPDAELADPYCLRPGEAARLLAGHPWTRFAVLGDSIAEGVGEPTAGYSPLPWADRIAEELRAVRPGLQYLNLGRRNTRAAVVRAEQLAPALAFEPDLALVACGGWDLLQPEFDPDAVREALGGIIGTLRARGADVITTGMFDGSKNPKVPDALRPEFSRRLHVLADLTARLAGEYQTVHVNLIDHPASACADNYTRDGRHGSGRGHSISAAEAVRRLGERVARTRQKADAARATQTTQTGAEVS
jgi:lysophospholipase L1-like esterase